MTTLNRNHSRYAFVDRIADANGFVSFGRRVPYRHRERTDTRRHVVIEGESLHSLAARYFAPLASAANYWWAIAEFQEEPITDPTIVLEGGSVILIPSLYVLTDVILGEARRREH